jgi:arabinogalactan oligomer/maltooligosaccharide transport system substrate-binding protein
MVKLPNILFNHYKEKEKTMKRPMFLLASLMLAASIILSACGAAATTAAPAPATQAPAVVPATEAPATEAPATEAPVVEPIEVTFWHAYGTGSLEEVALTAVLAKAAVDLPQYKINVLQVPFNDIFNKYRTDVAAGGGPDMFVAPNDSLGDDARAELIADITDLAAGKLGDYAPLSVEGMSLEGKLYGIPESLKALALWYDKSKLPTPPATTDELKKLMEEGTPISISYGCYHHWGFFGAFGGNIFDSDWKVVADSQGMIDAVTYLNDLYQISKANGWPKTDSDGLAPFSEGKTVAITNGNWAMGDYQKALGDNLAVAPLPAGPAGPATPLLGVDGYYFNPNSQVKDAAIEVALYLTGKTAEEEMMKAGHVPAVTTVDVTNPLLKSLSDSFQNGYVRPQVTQLGLYWSNFCGTDQVFEKGVDPATWLTDATAAANK